MPEEENPTGDVITEDQQAVQEPQQAEDQEGTSDSVTNQGEDTSSEPSQEAQTVTPTEQTPLNLDRPEYNIEREVERKVAKKLEEIVPKLEEAVKPKEQQYTIEQLEAFKASDDGQSPQNQAWANARIREVERQELLKALDEKQQTITKQQRDDTLRQQAQQQVVADPSYAEAFVQTQQGKTWNPNSQLAQLANQIMQDPRVSGQPDGLAIAMELAYARLAKSGGLKQTQQLNEVKRQAQKLKKQTITEGGGVNRQPSVKSAYSQALDRLSRSGKEADAVDAFQAYRKSRG